MKGELTKLHQAWSIGLIPDSEARAIAADIEIRFAKELAESIIHASIRSQKRK
jgi:hypothetical protein